MKQRSELMVRLLVLVVAAVALAAGVAEARTSAASRDCFYNPPYYVGACYGSDEICKALCEPYWPGQGVGGCTTGELCCICE